MNRCVVLVDNSNVFIGGRQLCAEREGLTAQGSEPAIDTSWRLDFSELLTCLADGRALHSAIMVGSSPPNMGGVWHSAEESGFTVIVHERLPGHHEKAVDTELVARGTEIIASETEPMVLVVASGDRDLLPLVDVAHRHGWEVEVAAFSNSFDPQGELASAAERVRLLDEVFERIGRCEEP